MNNLILRICTVAAALGLCVLALMASPHNQNMQAEVIEHEHRKLATLKGLTYVGKRESVVVTIDGNEKLDKEKVIKVEGGKLVIRGGPHSDDSSLFGGELHILVRNGELQIENIRFEDVTTENNLALVVVQGAFLRIENVRFTRCTVKYLMSYQDACVVVKGLQLKRCKFEGVANGDYRSFGTGVDISIDECAMTGGAVRALDTPEWNFRELNINMTTEGSSLKCISMFDSNIKRGMEIEASLIVDSRMVNCDITAPYGVTCLSRCSLWFYNGFAPIYMTGIRTNSRVMLNKCDVWFEVDLGRNYAPGEVGFDSHLIRAMKQLLGENRVYIKVVQPEKHIGLVRSLLAKNGLSLSQGEEWNELSETER